MPLYIPPDLSGHEQIRGICLFCVFFKIFFCIYCIAANQRDEVRDLHDVAGALGAQPGMKQQTFIAAGNLDVLTNMNNIVRILFM